MPQPNQQQRITVNLEDAVLEEQKLFQILEVSTHLTRSLTFLFPVVEPQKQFERVPILRRLVGCDRDGALRRDCSILGGQGHYTEASDAQGVEV